MLKKITEQDIESNGVASAPDKLDGPPEENKKVFDRLIKEVVATVVNAIIDAHNELCADVEKLGKQLSDHVDLDPGNLTAQNIGLLRALADEYGLTDKLAPTVHDALEVLSALANQVGKLSDPGTFLKPETAALFGLDETAVPDDVLRNINNSFSRVVTGTATGNPSALEDEPNSITFPFEPKLVFMTKAVQDYIAESGTHFVWQEGVARQEVYKTSYGNRSRHFRRDGNTLYWWTEDEDVACAIVGNYIALG